MLGVMGIDNSEERNHWTYPRFSLYALTRRIASLLLNSPSACATPRRISADCSTVETMMPGAWLLHL